MQGPMSGGGSPPAPEGTWPHACLHQLMNLCQAGSYGEGELIASPFTWVMAAALHGMRAPRSREGGHPLASLLLRVGVGESWCCQ